MKKSAQAVAKQVRDQSNEILKSATSQVSPRVDTSQSEVRASASADVGADPVAQKQKEQELINKWRSRISEIQSEESRAHKERQQSQENWAQKQEELMQTPEIDDQAFVEAAGKPQKGSAQKGAAGAIQRKQQKRETGRGAKN